MVWPSRGSRETPCAYDGTQQPTLLKPGAETLCVPAPCRTGSAAPWLLTGTGWLVVSLMAFSFAPFLVCGRNNQPALPPSRTSGRDRCRRRRSTPPIDSPGGRGRATLGQPGNQRSDTRPEASEVNAPPECAEHHRDGVVIGHADTQNAAPRPQEAAADPEADGGPGERGASGGAPPFPVRGGVAPGDLSAVWWVQRIAHKYLHVSSE